MIPFSEYVARRELDEGRLSDIGKGVLAGVGNLGQQLGRGTWNTAAGLGNAVGGTVQGGLGAVRGAATGDWGQYDRGVERFGRGLGQAATGVVQAVGSPVSGVVRGTRASRQDYLGKPYSDSPSGAIFGLSRYLPPEEAKDDMPEPGETSNTPAAHTPTEMETQLLGGSMRALERNLEHAPPSWKVSFARALRSVGAVGMREGKISNDQYSSLKHLNIHKVVDNNTGFSGRQWSQILTSVVNRVNKMPAGQARRYWRELYDMGKRIEKLPWDMDSGQAREFADTIADILKSD